MVVLVTLVLVLISFTLIVLFCTISELELYGTEYVSLMEDIRLVCNATGATKAPEAIDWFFNGDVISEMKPKWYGRLFKLNRRPSPGRTLTSEIIIEKATMADRGHYVCRLTKKLTKGFKVHVLNGNFVLNV